MDRTWRESLLRIEVPHYVSPGPHTDQSGCTLLLTLKLTPQDMRQGQSCLFCNDEKWHPVNFTSKSLSPAECNYTLYDNELLSVICGLKEWRHILKWLKHTIEILNDHRNLMYFWMAQTLNHHQAQWSFMISFYLFQFDYSLAHWAGRHSAKPDTLSMLHPVTL